MNVASDTALLDLPELEYVEDPVKPEQEKEEEEDVPLIVNDPVQVVHKNDVTVELPANGNNNKWSRIYEVVLLGTLGAVVGNSWNHLFTSAFDKIESTGWRFFALGLWCVVVTFALAAIIYLSM